jgi:hypothetical protein
MLWKHLILAWVPEFFPRWQKIELAEIVAQYKGGATVGKLEYQGHVSASFIEIDNQSFLFIFIYLLRQ